MSNIKKPECPLNSGGEGLSCAHFTLNVKIDQAGSHCRMENEAGRLVGKPRRALVQNLS